MDNILTYFHNPALKYAPFFAKIMKGYIKTKKMDAVVKQHPFPVMDNSTKLLIHESLDTQLWSLLKRLILYFAYCNFAIYRQFLIECRNVLLHHLL